jgi:hypothetical protein
MHGIERALRAVATTVLVSAVACAEGSSTPAAETSAADLASDLRAVEPAWYVTRSVNEDRTFTVARVDGGPTVCRGEPRDSCTVDQLDLARLDLDADDDVALRGFALQLGVVVWHGRLTRSDGFGSRLVLDAAWVRQAVSPLLLREPAPTGGIYTLRDVREACDGPLESCRWLRAEPISGDRALQHKKFDLSLVDRPLDDVLGGALARGRILAVGTSAGTSFVVGALYTQWPARLAPPAPLH